MQPYIFPYLGYFQLIDAVDVFVFYDDVNYIKRGWVNRNNLLVNGQKRLFTIPVTKGSQNRLINEIELAIDQRWVDQFLKTLEHNYKKAEEYVAVREIVEDLFNKKYNSISELAIESIKSVCDYLEVKTEFKVSSEKHENTNGLEKANRLIEISKIESKINYVNPAGGKSIYAKENFKESEINLFFIENELTEYPQFKNDFVGGLSILDVLMFNSKDIVKEKLKEYKLI
jgi:hypothetical protein